MSEKKELLDCKKCNTGNAILYVVKESADEVSVNVHKCDNCGYQYGVKELWNDNQSNTHKS